MYRVLSKAKRTKRKTKVKDETGQKGRKEGRKEAAVMQTGGEDGRSGKGKRRERGKKRRGR